MLNQAIVQTPSTGQLVIAVPRKDEKPSRNASLTIRYANFTFLAPSNRPKTATRKKINLNVISAREENPPTGSKPINWLLLTTLEVKNRGASYSLHPLVYLSLVNRTLSLCP